MQRAQFRVHIARRHLQKAINWCDVKTFEPLACACRACIGAGVCGYNNSSSQKS